MSWLSPKRRRTTGNLKTINGVHVDSGVATPDGSSPKRDRVLARSKSQVWSTPTTPPPKSPHSDGNLFYAYARRGDDLRSRYLLTFASAAVAHEWWSLVQQNFPDVSRPGPQLFSFQQDDLLGKAWRHSALGHLKTKWMFISFSDAGNVGGATQGIIPVQDANGNMLGGTSPATSPSFDRIEREFKETREEVEKSHAETGEVKTEVARLVNHFERMMDAVQRNTEQIAALAEQQHDNAQTNKDGSPSDYFDVSDMSSHLGRISFLLQSNNENVEEMTKRQFENEQKLREAVQESSRRQRADALDMSHLSSHLDRIQLLMEKNAKDRAQEERKPVEVNFAPLMDGLEKVLSAVEQNSTLVKALLDEGASASTPDTSLEPKQQPTLDLSPLIEQLEGIHSSIQLQSKHMQSLVGHAQVQRTENDSGLSTPTANLAPLAEHLEQIYTSIEDGNRSSREKQFDISPLAQHLDAIRQSAEQNASHTKELLDSQAALREAVAGDLDFTPLADHFDATNEALSQSAQYLKSILEKHESIRPAEQLDLTPVTDRLSRIQESLDRQADAHSGDSNSSQRAGNFIIKALSSHLSKIQAATEANASQLRTLRESHSASQNKMHVAVAQTADLVAQLSKRQDSYEDKTRAERGRVEDLISTMQELTKAITASKCEHVVVPPPRKTGRKVVGFVYDGKEDDPSLLGSPKTPKSAMKKT